LPRDRVAEKSLEISIRTHQASEAPIPGRALHARRVGIACAPHCPGNRQAGGFSPAVFLHCLFKSIRPCLF
jgi:hypothetical protein